MNAYAHTYSEDEIERMARKRAGMRLGWIIHASVYVVVNLFLIALALMAGRNWAIFPLMGWGLGLAIHGAVVLLTGPGAGLYQHLLTQERTRLMARKDAW